MDSGDVLHSVIRLHQDDNVVVLARSVRGGEVLRVDGAELTCQHDLGLGHKVASRDILPGEKILKYGAPIGSATRLIARGEHVHTHNMKSDFIPTESAGKRHGSEQR
jgi:(2R)-sulfolactate sulfo-lyase subunit alpha